MRLYHLQDQNTISKDTTTSNVTSALQCYHIPNSWLVLAEMTENGFGQTILMESIPILIGKIKPFIGAGSW